METSMKGQDASAQLAVKDAILARSGIYVYSREEALKMGMKPKQDKPFYREYRPAGVLIDAKDKFSLVPVPKNHPPVDITAENFSFYASGVTGGPIEAVTIEGGEVGLKGKIAFFTRDAYDHYMAGNKETSAGYKKMYALSDDPDRDGFDWIMTGIVDVNHVAVLPRGRGGDTVRVLDSAAAGSKNGGFKMDNVKKKGGFLASLFGIGKAEDENFKFSTVLMESVAKMHALDAAGIEKEVASVMAHVSTLGDSEAKEVLIGAVADCFKHPFEVIERKVDVSAKVDELYAKCRDEDAACINRVLESSEEDDEDKPEEEKSKEEKSKEEKTKEVEGKANDVASVVDAAVQKAFTTALSGLDAKIDASVKKALGVVDVEKQKKKSAPLGVDITDGAIDEDASYLVNDIFGGM